MERLPWKIKVPPPKDTVIQGKVTEQINSSSQKPLLGALVEVFVSNSSILAGSGISNVNGDYTVSGKLNGEYYIKVSLKDYETLTTQKETFKTSGSYPRSFVLKRLPPKDTIPPVTTDSGIDGLWHNQAVTVVLKAQDNLSGVDKTYYSLDGSTPRIVYSSAIIVSKQGIYTPRYYSKDKAGNVEPIKTVAKQIKIDKTPPQGSIEINNNISSYTNSLQINLKLPATDSDSGMGSISRMQFYNQGDISPKSNDDSHWTTPEVYSISKSLTLPSGDGQKKIFVRFKDAAGNWSAPVSAGIVLDTTAPAVPIITDDGVSTYDKITLHVKWDSSDSVSGIAEYQYKVTQDSISCPIIVDWNSTGIAIEVNIINLKLIIDKSYYFSVKAKNGAGLWSDIGCSDGIKVIEVPPPDNLAPVGAIKINNDDQYAASVSVVLSLSAQDNEGGSGLSQMQFSNNNSTWSAPEPYAATKNWSLSSGDGIKTVYVKYKDAAGNWSEVSSDTITLDATTPAGSIKINNDDHYTNSATVTLNISGTDNSGGSGISQMQLSNDNLTWLCLENYTTAKTWTLPAGDGSKTVYIKFKDNAGNSSTVYSDSIVLDTTPPSVPLVTDDGSTANSTTQLHAAWSSSDSESGILEYQYKITEGSIAGPVIIDWTTINVKQVTQIGLSLANGKTYYFSVRAKNGAGLLSDIGYSDGIKAVETLYVKVIECELSLGSVAAGSEIVSSAPVTIINDGAGGTETYSLSLIDPPGWAAASQTVPGVNTYVVNAAFDSDGAGINWSNANHALSTTPQASSATKFAADQSGVNVPYNAARKLWFKFKAPTSTTVTNEQNITIMISVQAGS